MVKPSFNIIVDGAHEDELPIHLVVMKMADPVSLGDVVVGFNSKTMRNNLKLSKGDLESMHLVPKCVRGSNNEAILELTLPNNLKLSKGDPESMHLMPKCVGGSTNKAILGLTLPSGSTQVT